MRIIFLAILLVSLELRAAYLGDISTIHSVTNLTALEALVVPDKTPVLLKGYYVEGDSPAVTYVFAAGDTSTVDNGSVVTNAAGRFKIQTQGGRVDIRTFGAIPDFAADITAVWTNNSTNITLTSSLPTNYVGKQIAIRRGNTSVAAEITLLPTDLSGTTIISFTVVSNGQGYISVPTVLKSSGPGSGGTFTPVLTAGQLTSITVGGGGGTGYTTNSLFVIRSTDCGTTNAPFHTEVYTVTSQSGTTIGMSGTPTFSNPLNSNDALGVAALYTDNQTAIQAAVDYAAANGLEVYIPKGDFCTGPVYLNAGQRIVGGGRELARLHGIANIGITTFRKSVLAPKNINFSNGRHSSNTLLGDVDIHGFTIDGEGYFQSPLGTNLNSGSFAVFGINCVAVQNWHIYDMTITNCQGGAVYYGSFAPTGGPGPDYSLVQSFDIKTDRCRFINNWRQAHQISNVRRLVETDCDLLDSSLGFYMGQYARHLSTGFTVGTDATYSAEEVDFEANSYTTAGDNKFIGCLFQNRLGRGAAIDLDQQRTDFLGCTFQDCLYGGISTGPNVLPNLSNNQDGGAEWLTINGCRFIATTTNTGPHLVVRYRGIKVIGSYFEGACGPGQYALQVDAVSGNVPPRYTMNGISFIGNTFNLKQLSGGSSAGAIFISPGTGTPTPINGLIWANNTIISGTMNMQTGDDPSIAAVQRMGSTLGSEGYAYLPSSGGNPAGISVAGTAGLGLQDFTFYLKYAPVIASGRNQELFRYGAEVIVSDKNVSGTNLFSIVWNPSGGGGTRTINVTPEYLGNAFFGIKSLTTPINFALTRSHGQVYNVAVTSAGAGYTASSTFAITFTGGGGTGATGFAQSDSSGTITNAYVTIAGSGYTNNPSASIVGGAPAATFDVSAARLDVWLDDERIYSDFGTNAISTMATGAASTTFSRFGDANTPFYEFAIYNRGLDEVGLKKLELYGPSLSDRWGNFGSNTGCVSHVKFNSGIGYFFEDKSTNHLNVWYGQEVTHGVPKRTGQLQRTLAVTAAAGATNSLNLAIAASAVLPANARITSIYAVPKSGAAPTVRIGFDSAITDQLVAPVTLTANTTNYLSLVPSMVYGSTNRPVYIGQTGAATNDVVINYSLDQGGLDGSTIQSGIVTAPGGLGSTSAIAATAIDATGWTNTFGVNAMVYAEGTGLQFTVYNAAGTPVYTNAATVGSASIALQKGAKMIVIAGTGVSGRAVPW